jgi:LysR family hydrogen peroxide-inducible transcriptional activator
MKPIAGLIMDRPTLQQLSYLVAVDEHRHFGKAAEACFVSQPALGPDPGARAAARGHPLRAGQPEGPAHGGGSAVIERARGVLRDTDELVAAARLDPAGLRGPLALGVIPTMAPYLLPGLLPVLTAAHREVELHLHELKTAEILRMLREGGLDLGLLALPVAGRRPRRRRSGRGPLRPGPPRRPPAGRKATPGHRAFWPGCR